MIKEWTLSVKKNLLGILLCFGITVPAWFLGKILPLAGSPIIALIIGMGISIFWKEKGKALEGIRFTSKKILQWAVILLGAGLNYTVIFKTSLQSLPIILSTISISLLVAFLFYKIGKMKKNPSILIGVGSSICGGSAVAATAAVIDADDEEAAQSITVIFFFNLLAALIFPPLGRLLGFDNTSGEAFGIFAGTAINDTSSVTAAAAAWDSMWNLGSETLDKAVTVKLTRTLAIIPITLSLAFLRLRRIKKEKETVKNISFKKIFPFFILYFVALSIISTLLQKLGLSASFFNPIKTLSKIFITAAMVGVGLNTNLITLIKKTGKPIFLGAICWICITGVSLFMQHLLGIW